MAAGLLIQLEVTRYSASSGSAPADEVDRAALEVMAEMGIDMTREFPKPLTGGLAQAADVIITMGCGDACPGRFD